MTEQTRKPAKSQSITLQHPMDEHGRCIENQIPLIVFVGEGIIEFTPKHVMADTMKVVEIPSSVEDVSRYRIEYIKPDVGMVLYTRHPKGWVSSVSRNLMIQTFTSGLGGFNPHLSARELLSSIAAVFPRQMVYMLSNQEQLDGRHPWVAKQLNKIHQWSMEEIDKHLTTLDYKMRLEFQKELLITMEDKVRKVSSDLVRQHNAPPARTTGKFKDLLAGRKVRTKKTY